jgi:hypothetical protein
MDTVWILSREFDELPSDIVGVFSTQEKAEAARVAEPNPEPIYGVLTITSYAVDLPA